MAPDSARTERLRALLAQITSLTTAGELQWERQSGSAHRYARWNNNLLILGPAAPLDDHTVPRYLFITPFDSPDCIEENSEDAEWGPGVLALVGAVGAATAGESPRDPFAVTDELLSRLTG